MRRWLPIAERREQVRAALAAGARTQREIAAALGVGQSAAAKIVRRMVEDGDVRLDRPVRGCGSGPWPARYALADDRQSRYAAERGRG